MIFNVASSPGEPVKQRVFLFWRHGCSADLCLQRQKPAMLAQMPLFVYRHFTGAVCTTSSDGRFALFSAASTAAFSVASRLSNSSDILLADIFRTAPCPWVACCEHKVQSFDLDQKVLVRGAWLQRTNLWRRRTKTTTGSKRPIGRSALRCGLFPQRRA